jgi:hypothetical protein
VTDALPPEDRVAAFKATVRQYNEERERWARELADDIVLETDPAWPDGGRFEGKEAVLAFLQRFEEAWSEIRFDVIHAELIGDSAVLAQSRWVVRGTSSDVDTGVDFWAVAVIDPDGNWTQSNFFFERERALEFALGA